MASLQAAPLPLRPPSRTPNDPPWVVERAGDLVFARGRGFGDPDPATWRDVLASHLERFPLELIGGFRIGPDGKLESAGDLLVHPKGFHHLGAGMEPDAFRTMHETDVVAAGVFAMRAGAFDACEGGALLQAPWGALDLGLSVRRRGGRVATTPLVQVRGPKLTRPTPPERGAFAERWGFDPCAPNMDVIRRDHAGSAMLWNIGVHSDSLGFDKYVRRGPMHWEAYATAEAYRRRADHLADVVKRFASTGTVVDLGCGDGLFSYLFATGGAEVLGVDPEPKAIECATAMLASMNSGRKVRCVLGDGASIPLGDGEAGAVAMLDVIEHLGNPARVLHEAARVLGATGSLVISTPAWQHGGSSDPVHHAYEFTMEELVNLVEAATGLAVVDRGTIGGMYRDLVVVARRQG